MSIARKYTVGTLKALLEAAPNPNAPVVLAFNDLTDQAPGLDVYFKAGDPGNSLDNDRLYITSNNKPPSRMPNDSYQTAESFEIFTTTVTKFTQILSRYRDDVEIIFDMPGGMRHAMIVYGTRTLPTTDHTMRGFGAGTQFTSQKAIIIYPINHLMADAEVVQPQFAVLNER